MVFDEATSPLDRETEQVVMEAIDGLSADLTILITPHRLTTIKNCTRIIDLIKNKVGSDQKWVVKSIFTHITNESISFSRLSQIPIR